CMTRCVIVGSDYDRRSWPTRIFRTVLSGQIKLTRVGRLEDMASVSGPPHQLKVSIPADDSSMMPRGKHLLHRGGEAELAWILQGLYVLDEWHEVVLGRAAESLNVYSCVPEN